ncbi:MAG: DNA-3-methyladenine glycosylase [Saprospiraceae bacterium]
MNTGKRLTSSFYQSTAVVDICRQLIGKVLVSHIDGLLTSGIIVEAEAYRAPEDRASHAYGNRRTRRTEVMFSKGGVAYIYICYGIHHLFNVVTGPKDLAHAILIRALEPIDGIDIMLERRKMKKMDFKITRGPGALSVALGFRSTMSGQSLFSDTSSFYIEDRKINYPDDVIAMGPRIGVESSGESAAWPWRYYVRNNPYVSAKRT